MTKTYISKLRLRSFKSFAKPVTLEFSPGLNCIIGANGSGKCVRGDTLIQLSNGETLKIKDLVEAALEENSIEVNDGFISYFSSNREVLSMNTRNLKLENKKILAFVKRKAPKELFRIKTRSGRKIVATEYHPLFILKDGKLETIRADELKEGTKIAVPRRLTIQQKTTTFYDLLDLIKPEDKLYIPHSKELVEFIRSKKNGFWKNVAKNAGLKYFVIKGLLDGQSINFAYLVKLLRYFKSSDEEIIKLVPQVTGKTRNIRYKMPWKNSTEFSRLLGYLLAEGRLTESGQVWFTNGTPEIVEDYYRIIRNVFCTRATVNEYKAGCWDVLAYSRPLQIILSKFGMPLSGGSGAKRVTDLFLKHSEEGHLLELLNGLYCGDGYISRSSIELTSKSLDLAKSIQTILLRLGILSSIALRIKTATNSGHVGEYYDVRIYGSENFGKFKQITLVHPMKQERLNKLGQRKSNPNLDLLEVNELVKSSAKELRVNIKKNKYSGFPKLAAYCYNQCTPSRQGVNQLVVNLFDTFQSESGSLEKLRTISNSDIYWDEIVELEKIQHDEEWVYDLTIAQNHNFVANNIIVHNSNAMDALCFVLGRLSTKSIRAENYSDLVHKSKSFPNATASDVTIQLDNSAKNFPVDSNVLNVMREIKKTGQTQYRLNSKRATRAQTVELLATNKIMSDGHNIILQGDVERFVSMSPIDKRRLIEEVAGIWIYESKKETALKELSKVGEKLREVEIVMSEKRNYMDGLESEKKVAEKYRSYKNELEQTKVSELKIKSKQLNERRSAVKKKLDIIDKKNKDIEKSSIEIQAQVDHFDEKLEKVEKEIEKRGGEAQLELQKSIDHLKRDIENGKTIFKSSQNEIKRIDVRKQQLQNNLEDLNKKVRIKTQEIDSLRKEKKGHESRKTQIEKAVGISEKDLRNLDTVLEAKEKEIESLKLESEKIKETILKYISEGKILDFKLSQSDEKLTAIAEKEKQVQSLKRDKSRFKNIVIQINKTKDKDAKLSAEIQELRHEKHATEDESARLRSSINAAQDLIMRDRAISKISSSKTKGVVGTVAELGRIDAKLKASLSVAAGNRMKNIVVDNENTAINCLRILRETKAGVATFLPLNKISTRAISSFAKAVASREGVIGFAAQLVSCDPKYRKVFEHVFRDTLIVENSAVAKSLGIGKFNMVTLDGDLFGSTGAITGGFRRSAGMSFMEKDAGHKLDALLNEADSISKALRTKEKERQSLEQTLFSLQSEKAELEGLIGVLDENGLDPTKIRQDKARTVITKKQFESQIKELEAKEKALSAEINKKTVSKNILRSKAKDLQFGKKKQEMSDIEDKINIVGGKISVANSLLEHSLQLEKKNIAKVLLSLEKEKHEFLAQITKEKNRVVTNEKTLKDKVSEEKQFFGELKKLFSNKSVLSEKIKTLEKNYRETREKLLGEDEEKNALTISSAKIDAELSVVKEELEPLGNVKELPHIKYVQEAKKRCSELKRKIENMGNVNMRALEIFEEVKQEFEKLDWRVNKLQSESDAIQEVIGKIETKKRDTFLDTFTKINEHFTKTLKKVSDTMSGRLILENETSPFEGGVKVEIKDAAKAKKSLFALSGGEKTLTALSFIFAVQSVDPAPFYLLDEIDAALDKVNSEKVAMLLKEHSKNAQVIIISHNDAIIHSADNIYGVWKTKDGTSQLNSLRI